MTLDDMCRVDELEAEPHVNPQPVVLYEMVKGWITGKEPRLGKEHRI